MTTRGKFIVLCGINGCGKTTLIEKILDKYHKSKTVIMLWKSFKCPDRTTPIGEKIDDILKGKLKVRKGIELKFFADNRKEIVAQIVDSIKNGVNVICDRYFYCNVAYTLTTQTLEIKKFNNIDVYSLDEIIKFDKGIVKPDCVFLIVGNYLHLRGEEKEKYHVDDESFNDLVLNNYLVTLLHTQTPFIVVENEENNIDNTADRIIQHIKNIK